MTLYDILFNAGYVFWYAASSALAVDAVSNFSKGHYPMAVLETMIGAYWSYDNYMNKKRKDRLDALEKQCKEWRKENG
jgi:hypothetical protein